MEKFFQATVILIIFQDHTFAVSTSTAVIDHYSNNNNNNNPMAAITMI
jgi:hypothetical protein